MNFQKFATLPLRTAQRHTNLVRQDNAFELLQSEAEKIRRHQVKMEIRLKEKDKEIESSRQTIDSLRKSMLETKVEKEKILNELQDEIKTRSVCFKKLETTRQMCVALKDELERLEDTLRMCVEASNQLREENEKKKIKLQKLNDDMIALATEIREKTEIWETAHSKLTETTKKQVADAVAEKEAAESEMQNANAEIQMKNSEIISLVDHLRQSKERTVELENARHALQLTVAQMLEAISELKRDLDDNVRASETTIENLRTQLNETSDIAEERSQIIRDMNEEYAAAKQNWQTQEERYQDAIKNGEQELENLNSKCEDLELEKMKSDKKIEDEIMLNEEWKSKVEDLESNIRQSSEEKDALLLKQSGLEEVIRQKDECCSNLENVKNELQTQLHNKEKKIDELVEEKNKLLENINKLNKDYEEQIEQHKADIVAKEIENENLKLDVKNLREENLNMSENVNKLKKELSETNAGATDEARKLHEMNEKYQHIEKTKQILEENLKQEKEKLKQNTQKVKEADQKVKNITEENEKLKSEIEEYGQKVEEKNNENSNLLAEVEQLKNVSSKADQALRQSKRDVNVFCMQLKETEKSLNEVGEKLMKREDEVLEKNKKIKNLEFDLKDKECEIVLLQEQNIKLEEAKLLQEQCSFSPETFQRRPRHRTQPEPKRIKEEPIDNVPKRKSAARTPKVQNILFSDTADELLSEVSFGSQTEKVLTFDRRKPTQKSSTPKAVVGQHINRRAQSATRRSGSKRAKHIKKETKTEKNNDWWENDSVYGFKE
ncbi:uncharacterized protein LOC120345671 [Styela clava]